MSPAVARFDSLATGRAETLLLACCGSKRWAAAMAAARPFHTKEKLLDSADAIWRELSPDDWREAFAAHPRIGERASGAALREQAGIQAASAAALDALARANREYESRFGHIYIVCASGRSAGEMLDLCFERLHNAPDKELEVAAEEQRKITRLRLERMLET